MSMIDELGAYLQDQGIGTLGIDLFLAGLPDEPAAAVGLLEYGGEQPTFSHGVPGVNTERRRFQLVTRAETESAARTKAEQVNAVLVRIHNQALSGTWYLGVYPRQSPFPLGTDANGRPRYVCNYQVEKAV